MGDDKEGQKEKLGCNTEKGITEYEKTFFVLWFG